MRILSISNYGHYHTVRPEAEFFIGLKNRGHDIRIITTPGSEYIHRFMECKIPILLNHPRKKFDKTFQKFLRQYLLDEAVEILHLFNSPATINGLRAAKGLPLKVSLYRGYHGNIHWYDPTAYLKYLHPRVDGISCLSDEIKQGFDRIPKLHHPYTKTIIKGHRIQWYQNIEPTSLRKVGVPEGAFTAVCVANARPFKGIPFLLEAMTKVREGNHRQIHLLLLGNGMDHSNYMNFIHRNGLGNRVHILGFRTDALRIVKSADCFVLASLGGEAYTKSVIEAMSVGTAPVITDIAGNKGLVINDECGFVVPRKNPAALAKAIQKLYNEPELCSNFGRSATAHIDENFNTDKTIREMEAYYEELLEQ